MYKLIKLRDYLKWISQYGWSLHKGKIDWKLFDENNIFVCTIKVQHPAAKEVIADSVEKTKARLRARGLL